MVYERPPKKIYLTRDKRKVAVRTHGMGIPYYDEYNVYGPDGFERTIIRHRPTGKISTVRIGKDSTLDAEVRLRKRVEPGYY